MNSKQQYEKIIDIIRNKKFWIYGEGRKAKIFFTILQENNLEENLKGFIVTCPKHESNEWSKKPVIGIDSFTGSEWILVCLSALYYSDIYEVLQQKKIKFLWILPSILAFDFGPPICMNVQLPVRELFKNSYHKNWIAACYLGLKSYFSHDTLGREIYIKLKMISENIDVARNDYNRFIENAKKRTTPEFEEPFNIQVSSDRYLVLDGAHRVALSAWFQQTHIRSDLYDCDINTYMKVYEHRYPNRKENHEWEDEFLREYLSPVEFKALKDVILKI